MKIQYIILYILCSIIAACSNYDSANSNLNIDFEHLKPGKLTDRETKKNWMGSQILCGKKDFIFYKMGITRHPFFISKNTDNQFLKVLIPAKHYGPITGAQWKIPFSPKNEYYFSYRIKFEKDFDFVKGGKLPGLAGGKANAGGNVPNGYDGWSARMMFWENGKLSYYLYFPKQSSKWGERLYLTDVDGDTLHISRQKWHTITQHVKLNTPNQSNGILQAWFDGTETFYSDTILFRKDEKLKIDQILFSVFLGGDNDSWSSLKDEYICFDDFRISTQMIY